MTPAFRTFALSGLAALSVAAQASAADLSPPTPVYTAAPSESRFYIGSIGGANLVERTTFRLTGAVVRADYEADTYVGGRVGYTLGRVYGVVLPRIEVEGGYARNSVSRQTVNGIRNPGVDSFGEARSFQGYGNAYFEIDLGYAVRPYVGGGVGAADVRLRRQGVSATGTLIDSSDTGLSYHYDAGLAVDMSRLGVPFGSSIFQGTTVEVGYRRTETPDLRFEARDGTRSKTDYRADQVTVGARKAF